MSNIAAQGRCEKLHSSVISNGGCATDKLMAEKLNWQLASIRSTASQLQRQGKLHIEQSSNKKLWVLFAENIPIEIPDAFENNVSLDKLATDMVNAITLYVKAIIANRI